MSELTPGDKPTKLAAEELEQCIRVLEQIASDSLLLSPFPTPERLRLLIAAGRVISPDKHEVRRRIKALRRDKRAAKHAVDRTVRAKTSIRALRLESVFVAPPKLIANQLPGPGPADGAAPDDSAEELIMPRHCYICKKDFTRLHHFYDALCPECGPFNYDKRFQTASLEGRVAIITGARLKIGYQAALMMLRAGARVVVTTRFPQDAAVRYAREADFKQWGHRLQIHGLDLRHSPSVEMFTRHIDETFDRLDYLINNAAQTVRRPPGFYAHLMEIERKPYEELSADVQAILAPHEKCKRLLAGERSGGGPSAQGDDGPEAGTRWLSQWHVGKLPEALGLAQSAELSQIPYQCDEAAALTTGTLFPEGRLDADLQQVDLRRMNTWRMRLADVPTAEMLEVQLINSVAPFILCSKLKPLMMRDRTGDKHIVNVSAMEGKFSRHTKTDKHPHTNMAKAALNMMTLTSARDYADDGIYMNAVDTGWVTDEDPAELSARKQADHDFQPPLDIVDGAARIIDPIFSGLLTGKHSWGCFLKDYVPTEW